MNNHKMDPMSSKKKMCFNPFGNPSSHCKKPSSLRPFPVDQLHKFPGATDNHWLCAPCRKKAKDYFPPLPVIAEDEDTDDLSSIETFSQSLRDRLNDLNEDPNYSPTSSQKRSTDVSVDEMLGLSPVKRFKLGEKTYLKRKFSEVQDTVKEKFESTYDVRVERDEDGIVQDHLYILSKIKECFTEPITTEFKKKLLGLLPIDWSVNKVQEITGASGYLITQVRKSTEEKGEGQVFRKAGNQPLETSVVDLVRRFYEDEEYSRMLPGIKDYVTVKHPDGSKTKEQKRLVLCGLNELHVAFKNAYPSVKVGLSKFVSLRPKHCCIAGAPGTHVVCVCTIHQNLILMLEGCNSTKLFADRRLEESFATPTYKSFLDLLVCSPPTDECFYRQCASCKSTECIEDLFINTFEEQEIDEIRYKRWKTTDGCTMETVVTSYQEFTTTLVERLEKLVTHEFVVKKQAGYYRDLKISLEERELIVVMDFAENYTFTVNEAAQAFHWNNDQATVFPVVIYYKENGELQHLSYVGLSDYLKHDSISTYMFQQDLISFLKSKFEEIDVIHYFSDGAPQHFKNKESFINLAHHYEDFGIEARWNFFPTAHGKGPCDGLGGILKRRAKIASLQMSTKKQILTPQHLYEWVRLNMPNVHVVYCSSEDHDTWQDFLASRFLRAKPIQGTLSYHYMMPTGEDNVLICKKYSNCETIRRVKVSR